MLTWCADAVLFARKAGHFQGVWPASSTSPTVLLVFNPSAPGRRGGAGKSPSAGVRKGLPRITNACLRAQSQINVWKCGET